MTIKRIQWIEITLFFIGTLSFFYWGANHPLPKEFMILGVVIFILSLMQYLYLGWFLIKFKERICIFVIFFCICE